MFKKAISLFMFCLMLVTMSPAVAAKDASVQPTVEEILNEYHQKAFEAEYGAENGATSTYSRRSGSTQTLEQETVDALNAAGYEAYNVTADNYDTLADALHTDFTDMGLDPNGSYIVVISGEYPSDNSGIAPASDLFLPPHVDNGSSSSSSSFSYTYNGVTYSMRYVTVTATENSHLRQRSTVNLNEKLSPNNFFDIIGMSSSVVGALSGTIIVGGLETSLALFNTPVTISLLLLDLLPDYTPKSTDQARMTGSSIWTVKYTQIYDSAEQQWYLNAGVEYVTVQKYVDYDIYNPTTHLYDDHRVHYDNEVIYSALYNDTETMKERAVLAHEYGQGDNRYLDRVKRVDFRYGEEDNIVLTFYRTSYDYIDPE